MTGAEQAKSFWLRYLGAPTQKEAKSDKGHQMANCNCAIGRHLLLTCYLPKLKMFRFTHFMGFDPLLVEEKGEMAQNRPRNGKGRLSRTKEQMVNCNCAEIFIFISTHTSSSEHKPGCCIEKENSKLGRVAALSPRPTIHGANCEVTVQIHHPHQ